VKNLEPLASGEQNEMRELARHILFDFDEHEHIPEEDSVRLAELVTRFMEHHGE